MTVLAPPNAPSKKTVLKITYNIEIATIKFRTTDDDIWPSATLYTKTVSVVAIVKTTGTAPPVDYRKFTKKTL